jgi:hypothetical protein
MLVSITAPVSACRQMDLRRPTCHEALSRKASGLFSMVMACVGQNVTQR